MATHFRDLLVAAEAPRTQCMKDINPRIRRSTPNIGRPFAICAPASAATTGRSVDARAGYPEEFVAALTDAGWLAALIPAEYGGGGLGVTEASVILEEINRSGANSGACHAQMYIMGTLLRHGSPEQKQRYLPAIARGELRLQSFAVTEPSAGTDTTKHQDLRRAARRPVCRQRAEAVDLARAALRPDAAARAHDAVAQVKKKSEGLSVFLVDLRGRRGARAARAADPQHGEPRDERGVLRRLRDSGGEPDRRGGEEAFATFSTA